MNSDPNQPQERSTADPDDVHPSQTPSHVENNPRSASDENDPVRASETPSSAEKPGLDAKSEPSRGEANSNQGYRLGERLLRVLVLAVCYFILEIVVKATTVIQFVFVAWKKRPNPHLQRLGEMIAEYMESMWLYCTFATDDAPWPYRPWSYSSSRLQS